MSKYDSKNKPDDRSFRIVREPNREDVQRTQRAIVGEIEHKALKKDSSLENRLVMLDCSYLDYLRAQGIMTSPEDWTEIGSLIHATANTRLGEFGVKIGNYDPSLVIFDPTIEGRHGGGEYIPRTREILIKTPRLGRAKQFFLSYAHELVEKTVDFEGKIADYSLRWIKEVMVERMAQDILWQAGITSEFSDHCSNKSAYRLEGSIFELMVMSIVDEMVEVGGIEWLRENGFQVSDDDGRGAVIEIFERAFFQKGSQDYIKKLFDLLYEGGFEEFSKLSEGIALFIDRLGGDQYNRVLIEYANADFNYLRNKVSYSVSSGEKELIDFLGNIDAQSAFESSRSFSLEHNPDSLEEKDKESKLNRVNLFGKNPFIESLDEGHPLRIAFETGNFAPDI